MLSRAWEIRKQNDQTESMQGHAHTHTHTHTHHVLWDFAINIDIHDRKIYLYDLNYCTCVPLYSLFLFFLILDCTITSLSTSRISSSSTASSPNHRPQIKRVNSSHGYLTTHTCRVWPLFSWAADHRCRVWPRFSWAAVHTCKLWTCFSRAVNIIKHKHFDNVKQTQIYGNI